MKRGVQILGALGTIPCLVTFFRITDQQVRDSLIIAFIISLPAYIATKWLIPLLSRLLLKRSIYGYDINKKGTPGGEIKIPESAGLAPGAAFLVCVIVLQQLHYHNASYIISHPIRFLVDRPLLPRESIDDWLVVYNAALATVGFMLFLGFVDDVLDVPWRVKLLLPTIASLPLLVAYNGSTHVAVPKALRGFIGNASSLNIGILYHIYMMLLNIFCTNSINILAGLNGLEAG